MGTEKITAEDSRKTMNEFNFGGMYKYKKEGCYEFKKYQNGKVYAKLEMADNISDPHNILAKKKDLDEKLEKNTEFRCGIISNGNHGLDLLEVYNENHKKDPIDYKEFDEKTRVMFVFDSPANNLKDCFGYDKCENLNELFEKEPKYFLCKHLWRSKDLDIDNCKSEEQFTESKSYGQMIVSYMNNCGIKNVYTTNLFRYEITTVDKEEFVSLGSMKKRAWVNPIFEAVFLDEVKLFKPDIIVAVGKTVFNYLNSVNRKKKLKKLGAELTYVYHPKARVSDKTKENLRKERERQIINVRNSK